MSGGNGDSRWPAGRSTTLPAATIVGRILTAYAAALDSSQHARDEVARWVTEHKDAVLVALGGGVRAELHSAAAGVTLAAWQVADQVPDLA